MSKVFIPVALFAVLLGLGGWLLAQPPGAGLPGTAPRAGVVQFDLGFPIEQIQPKVPDKPAKPAPPADGKFTVSGSGEGAIMVESTTSKTWVLHRGPGGAFTWLPIRRIDNEDEAAKLREKEKLFQREKQQEQQELLRRLEEERRQLENNIRDLPRKQGDERRQRQPDPLDPNESNRNSRLSDERGR